MYEQKIFGDISPEEREKLLEAHCVRKERTTFTRSLTDEEIQTASADYVRGSIDLKRMKDEAKEAADEWKAKIKEKETVLEEKLEVINQQRKQVVGVLFAIPNHADSVMMMYDKDGELIEKRPLKPEERQSRAFIEGPGGTIANPDSNHEVTDIDHEEVSEKSAEEQIHEMYDGPKLAENEGNEKPGFDYTSREQETTSQQNEDSDPSKWAWDDPRHVRAGVTDKATEEATQKPKRQYNKKKVD